MKGVIKPSTKFPRHPLAKLKNKQKQIFSSKYIPRHFKLEAKPSSDLFDERLEDKGLFPSVDISSISKIASVGNSFVIDSYFEASPLVKSPVSKTIKWTLEWRPRIKQRGSVLRPKLK